MASRDLLLARIAYSEKNVDQMKTAHKKICITDDEKHKTGGEFVKSAVYGGLDGILTIFAIASGALGSDISNTAVLILGASSLIADSISMGIGDYMGTKSECEFVKSERAHAEWEVKNNPEGEKTEMKEIYVDKGLSEADATVVVEILSKHQETWIDIKMVDELGLLNSNDSPIKNGLVSCVSFATLGLIPLLPYIVGVGVKNVEGLFPVSLLSTIIALFFLGALKTKFTGKNIVISGLETLLVGACAAGFAFLVGWLLAPLKNNINE